MAATMTMTEFNRFPSKVAREAERQDVIITNRGVGVLKVSKIRLTEDPIECLSRLGKVARLEQRSRFIGEHPKLTTDFDLGAMLDADRDHLE
jgi:PHD/YefM family antitoxin component YafN of YafNO toxin-antitoxin module